MSRFRAAELKQVVRDRSAFVGSVVRVETTEPQIVLTFDDGPDPVGTEAVLRALAEAGAAATFFVLLSRVRRHGSLLDEVLAAGHEVGLHGIDHQPLTHFTYSAARQRTLDGRRELEDRLARPVRWFRPPYGRQTPLTWAAVLRCGLTPVMWGPTTWDWRDVPQEDRVQKAQQGAEPGAIVLGHDGFAGELDGVPQEQPPVLDRADLLRRVLDAYRDRGLHGCSLENALQKGTLVKSARFRR